MSHTVIIAEKSSQAGYIAAALGLSMHHGFYEGQHNGVLYKLWYASGHLVEPCPPVSAIPNFSWSDPRTHVNIPRVHLLQACPDLPAKNGNPPRNPQKKLDLLSSLLSGCSMVIGSTDPDREGEAIYRTILEYLKYNGPMKRVWLSKGLGIEAIKTAFNAVRDASSYAGYYYAALGRRGIDYGAMVLTSTYTFYGRKGLLGRNLGTGDKFESVVSLGRAQTTVLAIIYARRIERDNFVAVKHFSIQTKFEFDNGPKSEFVGVYSPSIDQSLMGATLRGVTWKEPAAQLSDTETTDDDIDEPKLKLTPLFTDKVAVSSFISSISGSKAIITNHHSRVSHKSPPKPFSQTQLQAYLNGHTITDILATCQKIYEAGFISYPRSEESELSISEYSLEKLRPIFTGLARWEELAQPAILALNIMMGKDSTTQPFTPKCYSNQELTHEGLSPCLIPKPDQLTGLERKIFVAISQRFIQAHLPAARYDVLSVEIDVHSTGLLGEPVSKFRINEKACIFSGWESAFSSSKEGEPLIIPDFAQTNTATVKESSIKESITKKPPLFTTNTTALAMHHVHRFEPDAEMREILKQSKGIGTSATRPSIIQTLFTRNYVEFANKKKQTFFDITDKGIELLAVVPDSYKSPRTTAQMEDVLFDIEKMSPSEAKVRSQNLIDVQLSNTEKLIQYLNTSLLDKVPANGVNPYASLSTKTKDKINSRSRGLGLKPSPEDLSSESKGRDWLLRNPWVITVAMQRKLAKIKLELGVDIPEFQSTDFGKALEFINKYKDKISANAPSPATIKYAKDLATNSGLDIPTKAFSDVKIMNEYINLAKKQKRPSPSKLQYIQSLAASVGVRVDIKSINSLAKADKVILQLKALSKKKKTLQGRK